MRTICKSLLNEDGFEKNDVILTLMKMLHSSDLELVRFEYDNGISFVDVSLEFIKTDDKER